MRLLRSRVRTGRILTIVKGLILAMLVSGGLAHAAPPVAVMIPGRPMLLLGTYDLASLGYSEEEYFFSGIATSYRAPEPLGSNGRWAVSPAENAPYKTRLVVLRPKDATKFKGTVVVEWLNVSGGLDAPADWFMAHRELIREGYAYVAVSVQKVGIAGGASMGADMSLKKTNPARYGPLDHPGDAFAFDIFSQAGRLVRALGPGSILNGLVAKHVLAVGESQSAHFLTTYVNAVDPVARVYDGFMIHSRFGGSAPLDGSSIMTRTTGTMPSVVKLRTDLRVPVITLITETDLVGAVRSGFYASRQPDNSRLRIWEIPGTAHADIYTIQVAPIDTGSASIEKIAAAYRPTTKLMGAMLDEPINTAPQHHYVVEAALWNLDRWVRTGHPAPHAPRMTVSDDDQPTLVLDANGLATGGIRTPWVDVPIAKTSGVAKSGNMMAKLFGTTEPFDAAQLTKLYPGGKTEYLTRFNAALETAITAGFILPADRDEIRELASVPYPESG